MQSSIPSYAISTLPRCSHASYENVRGWIRLRCTYGDRLVQTETIRCAVCGSFPNWTESIFKGFAYHRLIKDMDALTPDCIRLLSRELWGDDKFETMVKNFSCGERGVRNWLNGKTPLVDKVKDAIGGTCLEWAANSYSKRVGILVTLFEDNPESLTRIIEGNNGTERDNQKRGEGAS